MLGLSIPDVAYRNTSSLAAAVRAFFSNGEQGGWYDPSDRTTLYQDAAGTTPVTAMEQPVGLILDKSKGLVLGPEKHNGDISVSPWSTLGSSLSAVTANSFTNTSGAGAGRTATLMTVGKWYEIKVAFSKTTSTTFQVLVDPGGAYNQVIYETTALSGTATAKVQATTNGGIYIKVTGNDTVTLSTLSIKELPGNHAYQSTSASRPVLSARVNLLTYTEQLDKSPWSAPSGGASASGNVITFTDINKTWVQPTTTTATVGTAATFSVDLSGSGTIYIGVSRAGASTYEHTLLKVTLTAMPVRYSVSHTIANAGATGFSASIGTSADGTARVVTANRADMRYTNAGVNLPPYQRVTTSTDYDTAGFPAYLKFDGIDDSLVTNSIDFTATDKMTVCAGVRKLSDAAVGILCELSSTYVNDGSFSMLAPSNTGLARYGVSTRGTTTTALQASSPYSHAAPITSVLSASLDNAQGAVAANAIKVRHNGVAMPSVSDGLGSTTPANYGNYPLYIGSRAGTSQRYNGHLYSLIVRGAQSSDAQIASVERYVNGKTKAY